MSPEWLDKVLDPYEMTTPAIAGDPKKHLPRPWSEPDEDDPLFAGHEKPQ